jgi:hypothetical protein
MRRWAALLALAIALTGCSAPTFPTNSPTFKASDSADSIDKPDSAAGLKGVVQFEIDARTRARRRS